MLFVASSDYLLISQHSQPMFHSSFPRNLPTFCFIHTFPLPQYRPTHSVISHPRLFSSRKKRFRPTTLSLADASGQPEEITCGDAVREWILARDRGELTRESPDSRTSCAAERVCVLFVGQDNTTVSAAAEAIFTDLCERRALDCFSSHSVGISVRDGDPPNKTFIEALRFKRGLDMSRKMACALDRNDLESYSLVVCMDEHTRSQLLYMVADDEGRFNDAEEEKVVVLSSYCSNPKLQSMQFRSRDYSRDELNFLMSALIDACNGLLMSLIESPPMSKS